MLRIINRILMPNKGTVSYNGKLSISLLALQLGFSPELSGRDNAIMGAILAGYTKKEALERLDKIIEYSELEDWINEPIKTYSTGMRSRLGFAIAMEMSPDVLLVDEVLGVGDEAFRKKSSKTMKEKMLSGQTVVFASHVAPVIRDVCTRLAWLDDGRIRMQGDVNDVLTAYLDQV